MKTKAAKNFSVSGAKAPTNFHADAWVDDVSALSTKKRVEMAEDLLMELSSLKGAGPTIDAFADPKQFEKLAVIPYIYYIPLKRTLENRVLHKKFPNIVIAQKNKSLPMLLLLTDKSSSDSSVPIDYVSTFPPDIHQILSYAKVISLMDAAEKKKLVELLIDGVESHKNQNKKGSKGWFSDFLRSGTEYEIEGFALNISYLNIDPKFGETKPLWVHGCGTPALLLKNKQYPFFIITGPSLRLDENIFGDRNMTGFTG